MNEKNGKEEKERKEFNLLINWLINFLSSLPTNRIKNFLLFRSSNFCSESNFFSWTKNDVLISGIEF